MANLFEGEWASRGFSIDMSQTLIETIENLDGLADTDRFNPLVIYAEGGSQAAPQASALVCPGDEQGLLMCPLDESLSEVLMVSLAKEAIQVWAEWRGGKVPTTDEKFEAVMFYAVNDAYLPVEGEVRRERPVPEEPNSCDMISLDNQGS